MTERRYRRVKVETFSFLSGEYVNQEIQQRKYRLQCCNAVFEMSVRQSHSIAVAGRGRRPTANMTKLCATAFPGLPKSSELLNTTADIAIPTVDATARRSMIVRTNRGSHRLRCGLSCLSLSAYEAERGMTTWRLESSWYARGYRWAGDLKEKGAIRSVEYRTKRSCEMHESSVALECLGLRDPELVC